MNPHRVPLDVEYHQVRRHAHALHALVWFVVGLVVGVAAMWMR